MRSREVDVCLLVLLSVGLALAEHTFAGGGLVAGPWSTRLEDGVAPELTVNLDLHRRVLAGRGLDPYSVLKPDNAACHPGCAAPGRPYTGRGCPTYYGCRRGN
ncbi:hypothetical protein EJB05_37235, partial [Eragrostis curvula]